jgi:hypothetical protein
MNAMQAQRGFLPTFALLLVVDFLAQLVNTAGIIEFQPLVSLWSGPLDDIFYGLAGVQALYYLIDPSGETRDSPLMSWTATVKKIAALLAQDHHRRAHLPQMFFTGSLRAVALVGDGVVLAVVASGLAASVGVTTLLVLLQRHLSFVLPVAVLVGLVLLWAIDARPQRVWTLAMLAGLGALMLSMAYDGRWANHAHHLLAALSNPQAWGAAFCWIGAGASLPLNTFRVDPIGSDSEIALAS